MRSFVAWGVCGVAHINQRKKHTQGGFGFRVRVLATWQDRMTSQRVRNEVRRGREAVEAVGRKEEKRRKKEGGKTVSKTSAVAVGGFALRCWGLARVGGRWLTVGIGS